MTRIIICGLLALSTISVFGQKISLKEADLDLSFPDYRLTDIIDGTDDEDHLGYIFRGAFNGSIRHIYFNKSITEEFEKLLKPKFSKDDDAIPLVIRVNSIEINEWSQGFDQKANVVSLSLSFFQEVEGEEYILITDRIVNHLDLDGVLFKDLPNRVAEGIVAAFDYLDLIVNPNKPTLSWSDLWEYQPYQGLPTPSLSDGLVVFEHYSDFKEGKAFDATGLELTTKKGKAYLKNEENQHQQNIWGASHKGILYLNLGSYLVPLTPSKDGYSYQLKNTDNKDLVQSVGVGMMVNNVLGLLSAATAFDKNEVTLSKSTGFLDIKSIYDQYERKDRSHLGNKTIIEFAPFGSPDESMNIEIEGKVLIQLQKGEFFQLPHRFSDTELQACVNGRCEVIIPNTGSMHRITSKKGKLTTETFTEKERLRYIRNVDLRYWVGF